jgi:thiol-disulfide isomerase/thioredoxin
MDDAKGLWKQMGGTEEAFARWTAPPAAGAAAEQQKQGRWEKPTKELPAFELTDISGKTWKLKSFEGKTLLINLWATWCGPCQAELPEFQKLYNKVKDRPDVQVISFNMDSDLGLVAPFMKEKGWHSAELDHRPARQMAVNANRLRRRVRLARRDAEAVGIDALVIT